MNNLNLEMKKKELERQLAEVEKEINLSKGIRQISDIEYNNEMKKAKKFILSNPYDDLTRASIYRKIKNSGALTIAKKKGLQYPRGTRDQYLKIFNNVKVNQLIFHGGENTSIGKLKKQQSIISQPSKISHNKVKRPSTSNVLNTYEINGDFRNMKDGDKYTGFAYYKLDWSMSVPDDRVTYRKVSVKNATKKEIKLIVDDHARQYFKNFDVFQENLPDYKFTIKIINESFVKNHDKKGLNYFRNMILKNVKYVKLPYKIESNNAIIRYDCVREYLEANKKTFGITRKLKNSNIVDWKVSDLQELFTDSKFNVYIYDQWINLFWNNKEEEKRMNIRFICGNGHLYPVSSDEFKTIQNYYQGVESAHTVKEITKDTNIIEIAEVAPITHIKYCAFDNTVQRFYADNILYIQGITWDSYKLYKKIGILRELELTTNYYIHTPLIMISEKYNLQSYGCNYLGRPQPVHVSCISDELVEKYKNITSVKEIHGNDRNKAYTYEFMTMPYIPIINFETFQYEYDDEKIVDEYFYNIIEVNKIYRDFINVGWCSGYRIKNISKHIVISKFVIPKLVKNPYTSVVKKMYEIDEKLTKDLINKFIGSIQVCENEKDTYTEYTRFFTNSCEVERISHIKISDGLYVSTNEKQINKKFKSMNMLPMAHYVLDRNINAVLERITYLEKNNIIEDLLCVKTDAIFYIGKEAPDLNNIIGNWKQEDLNMKKSLIETTDLRESKIIRTVHNFELNKSILIDNYAGNGKTFFCQNTIIQKITDNGDNYIVISAQWKHIVDYLVKGLNATTIASLKKTYSTHIPYKYVIIEEAGLISPSDVQYLYKMARTNMFYIAMGDSEQLPPVGKRVNTMKNIGIQCLFDVKFNLIKNYRNRFTEEEYDAMINNKFVTTNFINERVNKLSEFNICWYNKTRDAINNKITEEWIDTIKTIDKNNNDIDLKIQTNGKLMYRDHKNKLRDKNIMYNMILTIVSYDKNKIVLNNGYSDIELTTDEFKNNIFEHGYAMTLYSAEGDTIDYDKIGFHEIDEYKKIAGGEYVAYSRIKYKPRIYKKHHAPIKITIQ